VKRIGFARIAQETNALSPVATTLRDFENSHYLEGEQLLAAVTGGREVAGMFRRVELAGFVAAARERRSEIEPVAILSAWAPSSGPVTIECFETLEARLLEGVRRAHRDSALAGMYLCLHGAMGVGGIADPESRLIRGVREILGGAPLVVSHDLHGNLTRERVEASDAIVAYQTNPHRDHARIGHKAGRIAIGAALGELRPAMAWRSLPLILGGGSTIDFLSPMRAVFRRAGARRSRPRCSWRIHGTAIPRSAGRPSRSPTAITRQRSGSPTSWPSCAGSAATTSRRSFRLRTTRSPVRAGHGCAASSVAS
jgi:microcystin degradation protein MlrC